MLTRRLGAPDQVAPNAVSPTMCELTGDLLMPGQIKAPGSKQE